jgi:L-lactate dehydrogenase complex protein LldF
MARLDTLLVELEERVVAAGGIVHWARDADEANAIVTRLVADTGSREVVKVKSMATQEIGLNEALADAGITAYETDLAELIVQLGDDLPSHILVPAIHRNRAEIRELFLRTIPTSTPSSPTTRGAPRWLRAGTCGAVPAPRVAVSGANFAVAETGTLSRRRVRGQRADVPDPARDADHRDGDREARARPGATWRCSCSCCRGRRPASG